MKFEDEVLYVLKKTLYERCQVITRVRKVTFDKYFFHLNINVVGKNVVLNDI